METHILTARTVSTLLCHDHVPMAVKCLRSLRRNLSDAPALRVHDDGTLTNSDYETLQQALGKVTIVSRQEADDRVSSQHRDLRRVLELRKTFPLTLKVIDITAFCEEDVLAFTDSDVLYIRPLENPFQLHASETRALFMRDRAPSYSLRSWHKATWPAVRLPAAVNTGMIVVEKSAIDLDLFEWFVAKRKFHAIPQMIEQTFWAMLGMRVGCGVFDPRQARVMREGESLDDLVVGHFTARTRHLLPAYARASEKRDEVTKPVNLRTVEAGCCTAWHLFRYEAQRVARRLGVRRIDNHWPNVAGCLS